MSKVCPSCGAEAPLRFRFCGFCGATLDVAPAELPEPEGAAPASGAALEHPRSARRLVTVLFADLSNFTHAAARTDPEEIFLAVRHTLERLAQPVQRHGGHLDRYVGDGFLAAFGIPAAHENDPARALLTALEMQEAMRSLRAEAQERLGWDAQLRIGINLGPVISGALDTGAASDASVFGHAVNVAHRLQQAARPGTILVSEAVYRQTRGEFEFKEPVKQHLKGLDAPIVCYEVLGQRRAPQPTRGLTGRGSPLVGRSTEAAALLAGLQRLKVERLGMIAVISGEPGIGKTRLVEEVLAPLTDHFTIVRAAGSPHETASYGLLARLIENLAGIAPEDSSAVRLQRLEERLAASTTLAADIGPVLHSLVSGQVSRETLIGNPQQDQRRIYAAVRRLLAWLARRRAMLLVIDDLQWADPSSVAVLAHAADLVHEAPLGILALNRPGPNDHIPAPFAAPPATPPPAASLSSAALPPAALPSASPYSASPYSASLYSATLSAANQSPGGPPALNPPPPAEGSFISLRLEPLTPTESDQLLANLLDDVAPPPGLTGRLAERTNGNPLLMEEMVRMLLDREVIRPGPSGMEVAPQWVETVDQVPETVNGLILSRYDRLPPALRRTLDAAAVLGNGFSEPLLLGVSGLAESDLRAQLASLEQADFLRRGAGPGLPIYAFRHWVMQEAIYQTILQKERRALHLRAAQVIQQMAENLSIDAAARVGDHLERGQSRQAIGFLLEAARLAADRFANDEAISYYRRIEALLAQHGGRQDEAVDVSLGLTEVLTRTGQPEAARETLERARGLALGPPRPGYRLADVLYLLGQARALQGQPAEAYAAYEAAAAHLTNSGASGDRLATLARIEHLIGMVKLRQGQLAEARAHGDAALRLAQADNDLEAAGNAHNLLAGSHYFAGQLAESVASALRALALREQLGDVWQSASSQSNLGGLYYKLGQWAQAEAYVRQAIFVQQEIGDYQNLGASWATLGQLLLDSGRFEEALHSLNQSLAALRGQEHWPALASRHLNRGLVWLRLGVAAWAIADLERSLEAAIRMDNQDLRAQSLAALAHGRLMEQDLPRAREALQQAEMLANESGSLETRAEVLRARTAVRRAEHDWDRALEAAQQAQHLFTQMGNRYEVARRQIEVAEIQLARGPAGGRPLNGTHLAAVREALETFRHLNAQADLPRAEHVLARLSAGMPGVSPVEQAVIITHIRLDLPDLGGEGDELQHEELAGHFARMSGALEKIGRDRGALVATIGAGLAYLFSGPTAELSDTLAHQAVQAAREAADAGARLNRSSRRQHGFEIELRLGLAAGRWTGPTGLSAGDIEGPDPLGGTEARRQAAVFANASLPGRHAAAAAALAAPNTLVVLGDLAQPVRAHFELAPITPPPEAETDLPGAAFTVGRLRSGTRLTQPLPGATPTLIGRQQELSTLLGFVRRLHREQRGLVCYLEAEAGMGKTRLLDQVLDAARPDTWCLIGKCESFRAGLSYWALMSILEQSDLPDLPAVHQLQRLLGLRAPDESDDQLLRNLPPATLRQEIFARVRAFLLQAAAQRPVLVVVEDIHWLDLSSLELVDYLLPITQEAPVALLLVARAEMPGPHRALVSKAGRLGQDRFVPLNFASLSPADARQLVEVLLNVTDEGGLRLSPATSDALWPLLAPFGGHPLALEEAVRFLVESGWLWEAGGEWRLAPADPSPLAIAAPEPDEQAAPAAPIGQPEATGVDGSASPLAVPARRMPAVFRDLLLRRLDLLPSDTLHVLQAAAVLGERFDHTVLRHIVAGPVVGRRLSELVERGWLLPADPEQPLLYRFKHTLTRETIYATLLTSKRRVLHQRAAEAFESLYPEAQAENVELLAHHFSQSSLRDRALGYLVRAGQTSAARFALAESLSYFQQARDLLAAQGQSQPRLSATIALGLADVHLGLGDPAAAVNDLRQVVEVPLLDLPPEMHGGALRRMAAARQRMGEFNAALENLHAARQLLSSATMAAGTGELRGSAVTPEAEREAWTVELELAQTLIRMPDGQRDRARAQAEHVLRGLDRRRYPELAAESLNLLGNIARLNGEMDNAVQLVRESLTLYQAYGNRTGAASAYANLGVLAANQRDNETAFSHFNLSLNLREALGDSLGIAISRNNLGNLERNRGHYSEAIQQLSRAAERARYAEAAPLLAQCLTNLGQAQHLAGQHTLAIVTFDEAENVSTGFGLKNTQCEVAWKRADCLVETGDLAAAERAAVAALALAREVNSGYLRSEAQRALARALRLSGNAAGAVEHAGAAWQARAKDANPHLRARFAAEFALALLATGDPAQAAQAHDLLTANVNPVQLPESAFTLREIAAAVASA